MSQTNTQPTLSSHGIRLFHPKDEQKNRVIGTTFIAFGIRPSGTSLAGRVTASQDSEEEIADMLFSHNVQDDKWMICFQFRQAITGTAYLRLWDVMSPDISVVHEFAVFAEVVNVVYPVQGGTISGTFLTAYGTVAPSDTAVVDPKLGSLAPTTVQTNATSGFWYATWQSVPSGTYDLSVPGNGGGLGSVPNITVI